LRNSCVIVVTRMVVVMTKAVLAGPWLRFGIGFVVSTQVEPVGRPEQEMETLSGISPVGVSVAVKFAGTPAATVAVVGATVRVKSLTVTVALALARTDPAIPADPLLVRSTGLVDGLVWAVGTRITVIDAVASEFRVPTLHNTRPLLAELQVPGLAVADTKLAPVAGRVSVNVMLLAESPLLVRVN
jgi:hypothetical protein